MLIWPYVWLRADPWSRGVKQMVSAWSSWCLFPSSQHHRHRSPSPARYNEAEDKIPSRGFRVRLGFSFCWRWTLHLRIHLRTSGGLIWRPAQRLGASCPCSASTSGCSRFARRPQPTHLPSPRTHSPQGNTHLSGFLSHLLFGTKYTTLKVFLKNVLQQK